MGKTPKKAAPGGDERNLYVRRLATTTSASSKGCDSSLTARQRDSDSSNRLKSTAAQRRLPVPVGKVFKSKLRSPARRNSQQALKNPTRFQPPATSKDDRKPMITSKEQNEEQEEPQQLQQEDQQQQQQPDIEVTTMHPETEESASVQLKVSITKKDVKEGRKSVEKMTKEETEKISSHTNGKEIIDLTETENTTSNNDKEKESSVEKLSEKSTIEIIALEKSVDESLESIKILDESSEQSSLENDDNRLKLDAENLSSESKEENGVATESTKNGRKIEDTKENATSNDEIESKKMGEKCSVDVVESTTSETSDSGVATQSDKDVEGQTKDNDPPFVSYDSSILLKDVQIKLNDCLKDNSKLFEVSNVEDEEETTNATTLADQQKRLDMSFGKTLRNISGRSTINRLRYVTIRESRFSPNSSLFVNTSSASLDVDDPTSMKLIRHPTDLSDSIICNGSPADRKRKILENASMMSLKKPKTESTASSLLNSSLEMLRGLRRPVQVSTPNGIKGYEFTADKLKFDGLNDDKLDFKGFPDDKLALDPEVEPKKWCVLM